MNMPDPQASPPESPCRDQDVCVVRRELTEKLAQLEQRVATDPLTGLWNRNHFDHVIEMEIDRGRRHKQPLSLILFDVDHFKRVNDDFGHQAGDAALRELASVALDALRSSDQVFRWGGEEFAVLAPASGYRGAQRLAETLRRRVAEHRFPGIGGLTISLGVAEHLGAENAAEWFFRADGRLYEAKRSGRNRSCVDARGNSDLWADQAKASALHLVWQEAYECGDASIDGQHRELFDLANHLLDAFCAGSPDTLAVRQAFEQLLQHAERHFADEEILLAQLGYAKLDVHRRQHARLVERARELQREIESGEAPMGRIVEFLATEVVAQHLFRADRDFFPLLAQLGGRATAPVRPSS